MFIILANFRLKGVLKTSWQGNLKTSWRRLEDTWPRRIYWSLSRRLEDIFWRRRRKTSSRRLHQDECLLSIINERICTQIFLLKLCVEFFWIGSCKKFYVNYLVARHFTIIFLLKLCLTVTVLYLNRID